MTGESDVLVKVSALDKVFRRGEETIHVLGGLDLEIPRGEFLALMGPSGSGKSTLLNLIGGLDRPSEGTIEVAGERVDQLSGSRLAAWRARHVGLVFQFYNLLPVLTAERNVELPLLLTGLKRAQRRSHARRRWELSAWRIAAGTTRVNCPAASSSGWHCPRNRHRPHPAV
jgi:putative ABC transport system ATP-binding protein